MTLSAERKLEIAREAAAQVEREGGRWHNSALIEDGARDYLNFVQSALRALDLAEADRPVGETRGGSLAELCKPWEFGVGDPPDYAEHPQELMGVYSAGVTYAIERMATLLKIATYTPSDGSESFEGDVSGTIMDVLKRAGLYDDEDGRFATLAAAPPPPAQDGERVRGDLASSIRRFAHLILHGDDEHRAWLTEAAEAFVAGQPMPPPRGKGTAVPATPVTDTDAVRELRARVGHRVPRNVYLDGAPLFVAASEDQAAEVVGLLNVGAADPTPWQTKAATVVRAAAAQWPEDGQAYAVALAEMFEGEVTP